LLKIGGIAQVVKHLPSKFKALSSTQYHQKNPQNKQQKTFVKTLPFENRKRKDKTFRKILFLLYSKVAIEHYHEPAHDILVHIFN
jgi:hypothetical protein